MHFAMHAIHFDYLLMAIALFLAGCATAPPTPQPVARPAQAEHAPFALTGRVAVKYDGERSSAGVRWTHRAGEDEILLLAPLGQTMARIRRDAQGAVLDTPDKHYLAEDTEVLMQQVLGWHLPLSGLRRWVLGLPDGDGAAQIERDDIGRISVLHQSGWEVRYLRYADTSPDSLPLRLTLQREGLEIQLLIDEWEIQ